MIIIARDHGMPALLRPVLMSTRNHIRIILIIIVKTAEPERRGLRTPRGPCANGLFEMRKTMRFIVRISRKQREYHRVDETGTAAFRKPESDVR